ncbi:hypothetical protein BDA96_03G224200 [Sorghum bicolor]|uniref:Uncharacterized protein n=1 Tax=Sorghum bicolor TaxID=4558 RepID=A0A921RDQ4_SORBI|nr:hypothetical protein BDA96_03G224200 [Sorghum bicolor]
MAGFKSLGIVLVVVAALLAATARAVDDEHMYHWKCFKSCTGTCHDEDDAAAAVDDDVVAANDGNHSGASNISGGKCKNRCLSECFEDLPAQCYHQCVVTNCLSFPPFSNEKTMCLKSCCEKCFHHGPPAPGPGPKPPAPTMPKPPPRPPAPKPPAPTKPKPPKPSPPAPTKPKPPTPKAPPPPKKPCPPGSDEVNNN